MWTPGQSFMLLPHYGLHPELVRHLVRTAIEQADADRPFSTQCRCFCARLQCSLMLQYLHLVSLRRAVLKQTLVVVCSFGSFFYTSSKNFCVVFK